MAQGNMTVGKAIPENTPYRDSARKLDRFNRCKQAKTDSVETKRACHL